MTTLHGVGTMRSSESPLVVLDGGMGRELERIGAPFRQPEWSALALMEAPERVGEAHGHFVAAGADVVTTNTYALVPFHIGARPTDEVRALAARAGALARCAAAGHEGVRVAGSLPPLFGSYVPERFDAAAAPALIDPLVEGLSESVDVWLAETLGTTAEAVCAREAIGRADAGDTRPLWVSFAVTDAGVPTLLSGEPLADAVRVAVDAGAGALLWNCSSPESITRALETVADDALGRGLLLGAYANRFVSDAHDAAANDAITQLRDDLDAQAYCVAARRWRELGASIVGGCCGITPTHIAALRRAVV